MDELDTFCMSRSRTQEHDAVRRAMTTLMLELDKLKSEQQFFLFGITNVPYLLDTAVVRRFSVKKAVKFELSLEDFKLYLDYLSKPLEFSLKLDEICNLYKIYKLRSFTLGDIKSLYQCLLVDILCAETDIYKQQRLVEIF